MALDEKVLRAALKTMRPQQWLKNVFMLAGIIFSGKFTHLGSWVLVLIGIAIFSFLSGAVYILNDLLDVERDRLHPKKRLRPIPAGEFPVPMAWSFIYGLVPACLFGAWLLHPNFFWLSLFYFIMNVSYSVKLKHMVIFDVMIIAIGFVIRALAGAIIVQVRISPWMFICTLFLAMFLALGKRRNELLTMEDRAGSTRTVLQHYNVPLVDQMVSIVTSAAVMSYALYTISDTGGHHGGHRGLELTIPFVIFGIFRYLYLVVENNQGGSPERIVVSDKPMLLNLLLWVLVVCIILVRG